MTRMPTLSDRALRRCAWLVSALLLATVAVAVSLPGGDQQPDSEGLGQLGFVALIVVFPVTGALILRRQPRNRIGWLLQLIGLVWLVGAFTDSYATYGLLVEPGSLPGADIAAAIWAPGLGLTGTFLILLYPDGRLPSERWRPVAWLAAGTICGLTVTLLLTPGLMELSPDPTGMNPLGWESARKGLELAIGVFLVLLPVSILACAVALIVRFRRSAGVERLQLKWLAAAAAVVASTTFVAFIMPPLVGAFTSSTGRPAWLGIFDALSLLSFALLPAAIGVAILKHRLYDIDVVIKRTLVYALLTATLVGVYLGSVLLLQLLLSPLTQQSDLAVAGSTLAVAGLVGPARRRIQRAVDRRFYRSRYDASETIEAFAVQLRHELDVDAVGVQLQAVVNATMQPTGSTLWLRS